MHSTDAEAVLLRRLSTADLADFQAYRSDPAVGRYQGWTAQSDEQARAFLAEMHAAATCPLGAWFQLGIAERAGGRLIGDIGIHRRLDAAGRIEAEIGFSLARAAQGRGLARESVGLAIALLFTQFEVTSIVAITDARNAASIALLQRLGATLAGSEDAIFREEACVEHRFTIERQE